MILRPELLRHPLIPQPLHGINPRNILGDKWWNEQRKLAYEKTSFLCAACGTHKDDKSCSCGKHFAYKSYLEAHEAYKIDYKNHNLELLEVVALCHSCHNFIHCGRLLKEYAEGINSRVYTGNILEHGIEILTRSELKPLANQALAYLQIVKGFSREDAVKYVLERNLETDKFNLSDWDKWYIIIEGQKHYGISRKEWLRRYG